MTQICDLRVTHFQFPIFARCFYILHCLGLIDMSSANQKAESFCSYIIHRLLVYCLLFSHVIFFVRQNMRTVIFASLSFTWQYFNSRAYYRKHYTKAFLVILRVKQKISKRMKCWSSLFADILLYFT